MQAVSRAGIRNRRRRNGVQAQSAMEYLMTYGWAILIIAVVLGALYALGVFNAVNFMPKVPGGGCHVFRPNGPGTSWNVNLVGSCNNALPQYVAQFNGQSSVISATNSPTLNIQNTITITAWVYNNRITSAYPTIDAKFDSTSNGWWLTEASGTALRFVIYDSVNGNGDLTAGILNPNTWYFVTATFDGSNMRIYLNGVQQGSSLSHTHPIPITANPNQIGHRLEVNNWFNGSIANVQIYNTSLTANQVQYLYNEGIGGVPISPQYLVGWWPLNGDANDYSGNNNDGAATAVTFNGTWTGGYNVP